MPVVQFFKDNLQTLAAASWENADGTAGAGFENAATLVVPRGGQLINQGCDQTGSTTGVEYFKVKPAFTGQLGDATHPLRFDADGTAESLTNLTSLFQYWASAGSCQYDSVNGCHILQVGTRAGGGGNFFGVGGTFKHLHLEAGAATFTDQTSCTASGTWRVNGGTLFLDTHASNTFNIIKITGGENAHEIHRSGTTLSITGGQTIVDIKNGSVTNVNVENGTLVLRSHNATGPTLVAESGTIDFTELRAPITLTGAILGPVRFIGYNRNMVTLSSPQFVGGGPIGLN